MLTTYKQLDFIGAENPEPELGQMPLWNKSGKVFKSRNDIKYSQVNKIFVGLEQEEVDSYKQYWESVRPKNDTEIFQRWLFAFMSVHTTWERNVIGYEAIKDWTKWFNNDPLLMEIIKGAGVGLHNNRVRFISEFARNFWSNPEEYKYQDGSWQDFRDKLVKNTLGLGIAKVSFSLEMVYPNEAEATCMDTHLFQAFNLDQSKDATRYKEIENYWLDMCCMWNVPSYIARCILWDRKQGHTDSRYWSYVLED